MDKYRLDYEMKKRHVSQSKMCEVLGICKSAFYRKSTGKSEFTQGEIENIIKFLNGIEPLDNPLGIFFTELVS